MDVVARLAPDERAALFQESAARLGLSAMIVEKDFWVCWVLRRLFRSDGLPQLLFKGGTSLSKCYGLIERFSEDIDLGIEREDIGLGGELAPSPDKGSSSLKKSRKQLIEGTADYVSAILFPTLRSLLAGGLTHPFKLELTRTDTESVIAFGYPRALPAQTYAVGDYVASSVRLELGGRADHDPVEAKPIAPYAASVLPDAFGDSETEVRAQAPTRTLIEKALILHTDNARGKTAPRSSRHAYDLAMMHRAGVGRALSRELYEQVALHKRVFSGDLHAGRAPEEGIRVVPGNEIVRDLKLDYQRMEEMFFSPPPAFEELLNDLASLQDQICALG